VERPVRDGAPSVWGPGGLPSRHFSTAESSLVIPGTAHRPLDIGGGIVDNAAVPRCVPSSHSITRYGQVRGSNSLRWLPALALLGCAVGHAPSSGARPSAASAEPASRAQAPSLKPASAKATQTTDQTQPQPLDLPLTAFDIVLEFDDEQWGAMPVAVHVPARKAPSERLPVLIAFHGRGESKKGPQRGVRGWFDDYELTAALRRIAEPPLTRQDFQGFVAPERLVEINERLAQRPFTPFIIATPYLPDVLKGPEAFDNAAHLAGFVTQRLLPELRRRTPATADPHRVGVDGVSLGGRASLLIGFTEPGAFGAVEAMQPAVDERELSTFAELAKKALAVNPALKVRLVTSWGDYYLEVTKQLHRSLNDVGVRNDLLLAHGTHSYTFNKGPGCYEMLLFADEALHR